MDNHKGIFLELSYGKDIKIDLKDKKILSILGNNCRVPITNIAKLIHSSKGSVKYRIDELIKKDIYRNNITILNPFILGFPVYGILIKLKSINLKKENEIISFFENHPFIIWVGETQGSYDFNIIITARDINHFDRLLKEIQKKLGENIKETKILHMTKLYGCDSFPLKIQREMDINITDRGNNSAFNSQLKKPYSHNQEEKIKPSMKEILILKEIANNANLSLQEISRKTKIKPDTVKNTIKDLIQKNIILAFRGIINVSFLKFHGYITYFKLSPSTSEERRKEFEEYFKNSDYTAFGTETSGSYYDSMVYIYAQNPLEFNDLLKDIRNKFSDIIEEYATDLILKDYKFTFFPEGLLSPVKSLIIKLGSKLEF